MTWFLGHCPAGKRSDKRFEIRTVARLLWRGIDAAFHLRWMQEMLPQVRNGLQEDRFVTQRDMIEEYQMLVDLPHVAYMRHDWYAVLARRYAR